MGKQWKEELTRCALIACVENGTLSDFKGLISSLIGNENIIDINMFKSSKFITETVLKQLLLLQKFNDKNVKTLLTQMIEYYNNDDITLNWEDNYVPFCINLHPMSILNLSVVLNDQYNCCFCKNKQLKSRTFKYYCSTCWSVACSDCVDATKIIDNWNSKEEIDDQAYFELKNELSNYSNAPKVIQKV